MGIHHGWLEPLSPVESNTSIVLRQILNHELSFKVQMFENSNSHLEIPPELRQPQIPNPSSTFATFMHQLQPATLVFPSALEPSQKIGLCSCRLGSLHSCYMLGYRYHVKDDRPEGMSRGRWFPRRIKTVEEEEILCLFSLSDMLPLQLNVSRRVTS